LVQTCYPDASCLLYQFKYHKCRQIEILTNSWREQGTIPSKEEENKLREAFGA
jgi:hypothetical protein